MDSVAIGTLGHCRGTQLYGLSANSRLVIMARLATVVFGICSMGLATPSSAVPGELLLGVAVKFMATNILAHAIDTATNHLDANHDDCFAIVVSQSSSKSMTRIGRDHCIIGRE